MNPYSTQCIDTDDLKAVQQALQGAHLAQGPLVERFEGALADYLGVKHVVVCTSATTALFMLYHALDLANAKVITTPLSFVATASMLLANRATPIFCDIGQDGNINPALLENCLESGIKAVVSVDYGGASVDIEAIKSFCAKHSLLFLSDSSHAFGGEYCGAKIGGLADASVFSFHAIKSITTAEGGAIATNDGALYTRLKLLISHGVEKNGWDTEVQSLGFNFRMNELQAALGLSQLKKVDAFIAKREEIACLYDHLFKDNPYFTCLHATLSPKIKSANHLYPILLKPHLWEKKTLILDMLVQAQMGVQVHYKPIHTFKLYQDLLGTQGLPKAQDFYKAEISLPCHTKMSLEQATDSAKKVLSILKSVAESC
ncbi:UDP-4-keto-6-deoxy-N-acetylglucosamine 4-aminotransferase PseC [Helicobacter sp. NHP19-003]|uniref:UDP-4-amino-4,6-dideoxy-N-acetyl-beta-L-altrosamine transaminase n=1 Tax=Helicobacter gastrocanis TaxID=2849641 RepID=A0ABM7SBF2_9HELI|nr:UDP-4-amino-4,6-dideoxy-N-acetyl-beta-L-altrosamine transaminase [Helicobacter sp. NHP19-003]BCZ17987.1 UDP-4-keto-6-deoxy-N-acetylglucosamine 4-aminotransferase PseC [Helicobacter sp. NHP19-003]